VREKTEMGMGGRGRRAVCHSRGSSVGSAAVSLAFAFVEQPWPARTAERGAAAGSVGADGYDEYEYGDDADAEDAEQQGYLDAAPRARQPYVPVADERALSSHGRRTKAKVAAFFSMCSVLFTVQSVLPNVINR